MRKWSDLLLLLFPSVWSVFELAEGTLSSFIFFSDMDFTGGRDWRGIPLVLDRLVVAPEVFGGGVLRSLNWLTLSVSILIGVFSSVLTSIFIGVVKELVEDSENDQVKSPSSFKACQFLQIFCNIMDHITMKRHKKLDPDIVRNFYPIKKFINYDGLCIKKDVCIGNLTCCRWLFWWLFLHFSADNWVKVFQVGAEGWKTLVTCSATCGWRTKCWLWAVRRWWYLHGKKPCLVTNSIQLGGLLQLRAVVKMWFCLQTI